MDLMEKETFKISFEEDFSEVVLEKNTSLSEKLTIENSPILFGCRIGICGTCAVEVIEDLGVNPRTSEEIEYLDAICPEKPASRLACQIKLSANLKLRSIKL